MLKQLKSVLFYIIQPILVIYYRFKVKEFPFVEDSITTLDKLKKGNLSFARFGDGEFNIIMGYEIGFQNANQRLRRELVRVITTQNNKCAIGIPNIFNGLNNFENSAKRFWLYKICINWRKWKKFLILPQYLDSLSSRFYMDLENKEDSDRIINRWKELWNERHLVIVEGDKTLMGIGNDLFSNAKSIKRIICPSKNAFDKYQKILIASSNVDKDSLILIALGPTASILAYDLSLLGFQAIDTGHLDLEYNWKILNASKKIMVKGRAVNEIINDQYEEIFDLTYRDQIIKKID